MSRRNVFVVALCTVDEADAINVDLMPPGHAT